MTDYYRPREQHIGPRKRKPRQNRKPQMQLERRAEDRFYKREIARKFVLLGLSDELVADAIKTECGLIHLVAEKLGISRNTLDEFLADSDVCAQELKQSREAMGDEAEKKLFELIRAGNLKAIVFYLSTMHKDRGYGLRQGESPFPNSTFVDTINIVGVPRGQFLTQDETPAIEGEVADSDAA